MKKFLTVILSLLIFSGFAFAEDFPSEAEDISETAVEETASTDNEYFIGFDVSVLGIEPTFQMVRKEHMEINTGISFIQYPSSFVGYGDGKTGVITPIADIGYRTNFYVPNSAFSVGLTAAVPLMIEQQYFSMGGFLAIYFRVSKQLGIFELGGKTYVPVVAGTYSTCEDGTNEVKACFANWEYILGGLAFTSFEVKVHIK